MTETAYYLLLKSMVAIAFVVFVALYFVKAGYGKFRTPAWGFSINNKTAWVLMEAPVFFTMAVLWLQSADPWLLPQLVLFLLFELHYFQRSFVFPLLLKGKGSMPVCIMLMGVTFNVVNGMMQAGGLFLFPPAEYADGAAYLIQPRTLAGIAIFFAGMAVNIHSDHVIRSLRKPGDTNHYLPERGMYRFVTSANYFGELVEWTGFAIASSTWASWVFVLWTAANLVPRAAAIYNRYAEEFGDVVYSRKRIIPFVY
ncbi:MAG: DUF1295 domain-containing protein [Bacteroidales bacterium]|nr:DUF1295 domain-containing protein [Bacteroidales bacterium]MDY4926834.1 DUF1295 domain-containing protein [Prevotella sp.]MDY5034733.1 DUF1295 domain-containing protein [Prevotella sp.]